MEQQNFSQSSETQYANVSSDERTMAILAHVLSVFFWIFPGLIIYLLKKDESPYVAEHAKEAMNFQISITIFYIISGVLMLLLIGFLLMLAVYVGSIILCIIATIKASDNVLYKYPFTIRLIK
ncbi:MAG: DUF4870 domain-containing protein [Chitinophagaceae bacterium]|nr:DUF4870 domain-containing protein [Chitinophagaceae bacterium]